MLQAGKSPVRVPMKSLDFSVQLIFPAALWAWGSTQPLAEISTRNLPGVKGQPARKADHLTAINEPIIQEMWEPLPLTDLWVSTACYRNSFAILTFFYILFIS
jgi:hypothetical protein